MHASQQISPQHHVKVVARVSVMQPMIHGSADCFSANGLTMSNVAVR
jgi:hypothetical protein